MAGIPRSLGILSHKQHRIASQLAGVIPLRFAGSQAALFEILTGTVPPSGGGAIFAPHDHSKLGLPIPRAGIWSWDGGELHLWQWMNNNTGTQWWRLDPSSGGTMHAVKSNDAYPCNLMLPVSHGIDKSKSAYGGGNCRVEYKMLTYANYPSVMRLRNRSTGDYSDAAHVVNGLSWVAGKLLVQEGWNEIDIEGSPSFPYIQTQTSVLSLVFAETQLSSLPLSDGTHTL